MAWRKQVSCVVLWKRVNFSRRPFLFFICFTDVGKQICSFGFVTNEVKQRKISNQFLLWLDLKIGGRFSATCLMDFLQTSILTYFGQGQWMIEDKQPIAGKVQLMWQFYKRKWNIWCYCWVALESITSKFLDQNNYVRILDANCSNWILEDLFQHQEKLQHDMDACQEIHSAPRRELTHRK